ncbi:MAG: hypothetical protein BWY04_01170 [candidate division CPR1 bacterium ADurb.Bin160]|uniref:Uncharacterized protein n=1 Tax=candidate division CPR1 bacterium ADurb.Bin160 TaxID=1852826 RepID=A0A1V5ZKX8_9BACT|nr:MAG: hypothetical protein BWY04_01170 [candidate division CPR1 bacterium ADurb.Bin160]
MNNLKKLYIEEVFGNIYLESSMKEVFFSLANNINPTKIALNILNTTFDLMTSDELMGVLSMLIKAPKISRKERESFIQFLDSLYDKSKKNEVDDEYYEPIPPEYYENFVDKSFIIFNKIKTLPVVRSIINFLTNTQIPTIPDLNQFTAALTLYILSEGMSNTIIYIQDKIKRKE